jgi:SAM-dependent methyltransferase
MPLPPPTPAQLSGEALYGDDFTPEQVAQWFADEAEAYYELGGDSQAPERYGYEALNRQTLFAHLPEGRRFGHALGFGSGYGTELVPLAARIDELTIVESSARYGVDPGLSMPVHTVAADPRGQIALPDASVDLISCLGVLHHIPNVTFVIGELARVCAVGGYLLLREPVTSMGDWRRRRPGLTVHERGIPLDYLQARLRAAGFEICRATPVIFPLVLKLWRYGPAPYASPLLTRIDRAICRLVRPNLRYHATTRRQKVRPAEIAVVARRVA